MSRDASSSVPRELLQTRPEEDSGTTTSGYYEYQYGWVAQHALEMTNATSGLEWILCEWHTDFILGWGSAFAPVSVKHREPNSGRWTVAKLFSDGGLLTLYKRWLGLGRPAECRWVTNGGWDTDCAALASACAPGDCDALNSWLDDHAWRFDGESRDDVRDFLVCLRMNNNSARTADQRVVNVERCSRPALRRLGLTTAAAGRAYDEVVGIARKASQGFGGTEPTTWCEASQGALDHAVLTRAAAENRLIRRDQIATLLRGVADPASADPPPATPGTTTLMKKLNRGEVVPTARAAARRNRLSWTAYEAAYVEPLPAEGRLSQFDSLRARVLSEATDAQLSAKASGEPYGDEMLQGVRERMRGVAGEPAMMRGLTADLLMGLVYDLTARCEVWWSPWFDVDPEEDAGGDGGAQ